MAAEKFSRRIRSFVRREGRFTSGQRRAFEDLWPRYGVTDTGLLQSDRMFDRHAPLTLEIGFGNGENLARMAIAEPNLNFIGIEVHRPGVGHLLRTLAEKDLCNVRVICADAVEVLESQIPDHVLDRVLIFFPDPWHKKRHHKRRLIQPAFIELLGRKMAHGGLLHIATDWEDYAKHALATLTASDLFRNKNTLGGYSETPAYRSVTRFERRGRRLGHAVFDLLFRKI